MASSTRGIRLLKTVDFLKTLPNFDCATILSKLKFQSVNEGALKASFIVDCSMCNIGGTLHGGYIASAIDVLSFYTQLSASDGRVSWTTNMNVHYTGAIKEGDRVNVETKSLKSGKSPLVETWFYNDKGHLLAKGIAAFLTGGENYQREFKNVTNFDVNEI